MARKRKTTDYYIAYKFLDARISNKGETECLIKWQDHDEQENSWITADDALQSLLSPVLKKFTISSPRTKDVTYPPRRLKQPSKRKSQRTEEEGDTAAGNSGFGNKGPKTVQPGIQKEVESAISTNSAPAAAKSRVPVNPVKADIFANQV